MAKHGSGAGRLAGRLVGRLAGLLARRLARRLGRARTALMVLGLGVTVLSGGPVRAESQGFLCPSSGRLVSVGLRTDEVKKKCREPDDVQAHVEFRTVRESRRRVVNNGAAADVEVETTVEVSVEEWFYDFGSARFTKTLRFEDGRLVNFVEGAKGSPGGG